MKCEEMQGRLSFSNDIFAVVAILYLEFFNTKEFKALSAKKIDIDREWLYLARVAHDSINNW